MIARENINSFWASLIVEELVRHHITFFCISPGSRSTPLTVAATKHPQTHCHLCLDERGAAFMALGYARATGTAAVLICTSGTAAAHYFPALIEASMDDVPMIILTADRPPELLDTGANQTIHQQNVFGYYTRRHTTLPAPSAEISPRFVLTTMDQAALTSKYPIAGPVHVNCMFRDPLAPTPKIFSIKKDSAFDRWQYKSEPFTQSSNNIIQIEKNELDNLAHLLSGSQDGLVLLGRLPRKYQHSEDIRHLLKKLNWPVYADIASGFRLGPAEWPVVHENYFFSDTLKQKWQPDTVLHLGGTFISKRLQTWLEDNPPQDYLHCFDNPRRFDPGHLVTKKVIVEINSLCAELAERIVAHRRSPARFSLDFLKQVEEKTRQLIGADSLNEPGIANIVSQLTPAGHGLFLGNSMPIRDMNAFALFDASSVDIVTNRGASGIDGNIATAIGFAHGLARPVTAILGDVAALHDLNSLHLLKKSPPVILIIINNDGSGIFSFLPISQFDTVFNPWFSTPHGLTFEHAAKQFDLPYMKPQTQTEFQNIYKQAVSDKKSIMIEIQTNQKENLHLHRQIEKAIQQFIDSV